MILRGYRGAFPRLGERVFLAETAAVIGDVELGDDVSVWYASVVRGDCCWIRVGARSNIQDNTVIHVSHRHAGLPEGRATRIGEDVTVGHRCILHACIIGNTCLIGMGSIILDGAVLHDQVLLGAGSLVTEGKELEGGYLWLGQPARRVRPLTGEELAWLEYSARHYVKLKDDYL